MRLGRDTTLEFVDENTLRSMRSPLISLIASVQYWSPSFDLSKVNIVTDRNNLSKLVGWITRRYRLEDFRIDLELSGPNTVLFTRWDKQTHFRIGNGYGETFKWATTTPTRSRKDRFGHYRIVTYVCVVKFVAPTILYSSSPCRTLQDSNS